MTRTRRSVVWAEPPFECPCNSVSQWPVLADQCLTTGRGDPLGHCSYAKGITRPVTAGRPDSILGAGISLERPFHTVARRYVVSDIPSSVHELNIYRCGKAHARRPAYRPAYTIFVN